MSEERLQEIKDSIEFQYTLAKAKGYDNALLFTNEEEELVEEIERLNNIIKRLEELLEEQKDIINKINILIKHDYFKARELKEEIQRSNLYQGDYPIAYYHAEWLEDITDIYLNKIQEIRGSDKE